ncbi:YiiX/YebB-like N1pC/P60 family cysteine hydrolase [Bradyrhizobium erythrophlei]|uniref:YiiX/YebB-like N1pC/P60 family cysteine hydrolase n=1 Tax=Bradyrhizobium erythrophlei TaxID=1437360 RepID=UPI0035EB3CEE
MAPVLPLNRVLSVPNCNMMKKIGLNLARFLSRERHAHRATPPTTPDRLLACLEPVDVLLVEGNSQISTAIKYLTQSTWSHAALYVGAYGGGRLTQSTHCFIEADLIEGVRSVSIEAFAGVPTRICRPVGLSEEERRAVIEFAIARLGHRYDLKNVVDLARYLLPTPPVPTRIRRRMIAFGSGDPTRAICSTLIAEAFQFVHYPVLPAVEYRSAATKDCPECIDEIMHIRHHSLFVPRDFDVSPYFRIVKPTIEGEFDFRTLKWS